MGILPSAANLPDPLPQLRDALSDRYRLERELGQGGMATVYLAEDLKHSRKVAIKVLRPELAAVIGAERFLREIKTIATLQHPHILGLIDSGEARVARPELGEGSLSCVYYVMPFVEGESLRDRLNREKQLPIGDAIRIATEVAGALDYAHRHGVIHRDIKPENILLHDGSALVADFGIALAISSAGSTRMTETGMSLGTPHYMSPEQAMGEREITARSDVYALGCVTYEMLTGDPPFMGSTAQAIVAKVMTEKPIPPSRMRDTVPARVEHAVLTALQKLPADRFSTAAEFAAALAASSGPATAHTAPAIPLRRWSLRSPVPWALTAVLAFGAAIGGWWRGPAAAPAAVVRFELQPSTGTQIAFPVNGIGTYLALSPDGRQVVYAVSRGGSDWALHIRNLNQLNSRELPGTAGARSPEFSPDGRWIAFGAADGSVKKIAADGTSLTTVCELDPTGITGLTWTSNREIVFSRINLAVGWGIWRVPAEGGEPLRFSKLATETERLQLMPLAADGGRLLFYTSGKAGNADLKIGVVSAATGEAKMFPGLQGFRALGLVDGQLIYVRGDGILMAARFDVGTLTAGRPVPVLDSVTAPSWLVPAALSASGALLYQRGGQASYLMRVDARGVARRLVDSAQSYLHPRLSPDGRRLAYEVLGGTGTEIWISDLATQAVERLTRDGYSDRPEWSPDGKRIMYTSSQTPRNSLWWQPSDGSGKAELLHQSEFDIREGVFTPRGDAVVYRADTPDRNRDIYLLPLTGDDTVVPLLDRIDDDKHPRVSPDGRWLAFVSNESGREEVYVRTFANGGGRVPISTGGGGEPLWAPDSRWLYYRAGAKLIAAHIVTVPALAVVGRDTLFTGPYMTDPWHQNYDVAPDGRSFVMIQPVEENRQLIMVLHWTGELKQRLRRSE
ncbi:MAG: protein kinase [Gemmatimonadota bacterium]|nr:protein kinase [Gemmatimonadota bacterium]